MNNTQIKDKNKTYKVDFIDLRNNQSYFYPIEAQTIDKAKNKFIKYMKRNDNSIIDKDYKIESIDTNLMGFYSNW